MGRQGGEVQGREARLGAEGGKPEGADKEADC